MKDVVVSFLGGLVGLLVIASVLAIAILPTAFVMMISFGNAFHASGGLIPALSFSASFWLSVPIIFVAGSVSSTVRNRSKD